MKQTAVEWLREKLQLEFGFIFSDNILEQAKEMEKEQMMQCYEDGYNRVAKLIEDAAKQNGLNLNL
jgi:hypothetical protein